MPARLAWAATPVRASFVALAAGMMVALASRSSHGVAQTPAPEGAVRLIPALSNVPAADGPFTVYVVAENLQHNGAVTYDNNRDGTPDGSNPSIGLAAFQFTLTYNPAIVAIVNAEAGPDVGRSGRQFQCLPPIRDPDKFTFGCISLGNSPDGTQGTLTLGSIQIVPVGPGLSPLQVDAVLTGPLGDNAPVDVAGGAVRVTGNVVGVTRTPTNVGAQPTGASTLAPATVAAQATATARANATAQATGTTAGTTAQTPATGVPKPSNIVGPGGKSSRDGIWWAVGVGASVGVAALSLGGVLWRRRQVGSE